AIGLLVLLSLLPIWFMVQTAFEDRISWERLGRNMNGYVRTVGSLIACLTLLAVAVRASGCLSSVRDQQTIDGLLSTPMDGAAILVGKWLGCIASVRWAWVWLGLVWFCGIVTGGLHVASVPLVIGAWLVYASFFACVGMWFSLVCRTTTRATLWTLLTTL